MFPLTPGLYRRRWRGAAFALIVMAAMNTGSVSAQALPPSDLASLVDIALSRHPALASGQLGVDAARANTDASGALPDPRFQIELMDATNAAAGDGASLLPGQVGSTRYRLIQPLPFPGKLALQTELAQARIGNAQARLDATRLELAARVKRAFARYYLAHHQQAIIQDNLDLLAALEPIILTRYEVGIVPQQDAIAVQSEVTRLRAEMIAAVEREGAARASLNASLLRPADAPLAPPGELPEPAAPDTLQAYRDALAARSPQLADLRARVATARASRALTYRDRYPDMAVGLTNNRPRKGADTWDVMLEVTIPIQQSARRAREREAEHLLLAAQSDLESLTAGLDGQLGERWARLASSRETARLLEETLLPQVRAAYESAEAAYETGQVNFNTLIDAEQRVLSTRLALLTARVDQFVSRVDLEELTGVTP